MSKPFDDLMTGLAADHLSSPSYIFPFPILSLAHSGLT